MQYLFPRYFQGGILLCLVACRWAPSLPRAGGTLVSLGTQNRKIADLRSPIDLFPKLTRHHCPNPTLWDWHPVYFWGCSPALDFGGPKGPDEWERTGPSGNEFVPSGAPGSGSEPPGEWERTPRPTKTKLRRSAHRFSSSGLPSSTHWLCLSKSNIEVEVVARRPSILDKKPVCET